MNAEQELRLASIKALSVDLLTAAHDQDEGRLLSVMAELSELFRVVRMDYDTRRCVEPEPTATRSPDTLDDLVGAEFMKKVCLPENVNDVQTQQVDHEDGADVAPKLFEIAADDDDDDDESVGTDVDHKLIMSGMYDASAKWL